MSFAYNSTFWLGNWVFYYLQFGNYATVALLDSGAMMAGLLMEIPTGAFADIFGKKKTLMLAFLLQAVGAIVMGLSSNFWTLALSLWILVCSGGAFYSGTLEALVYDSLKQNNDEDSFDRKIGTINATRLWSMAICAIIGGLVYKFSPGLPFILNGVMCLIGFVVCFGLEEPKIDTEKYTWLSFFKQNTAGIRNLFANDYIKRLSLFLVATGALCLVIYNLLDDLLAIEYGYTPMGISILFSIACLIAGAASIFFSRTKFKLNIKMSLIGTMVIMGLIMMLSPVIGMLASAVFLMVRVILEVIYDNATSVIINRSIESKSRATTLSSLSLLRHLPYALTGSLVGASVVFAGGARQFSMWYGLIIILMTIIFGFRLKFEREN